MKIFLTGGAGFIGSNLCDELIKEHHVTVWDNFSTGKTQFLTNAVQSGNCSILIGDILDSHKLHSAMAGHDVVIHLAANADVRDGLKAPSRDLEQNTIATHQVLEGMRKNNIKRIIFSSTGSVYGETTEVPTPETARFPIQTSLYGASKVAAEALIAAYAEGYGMTSTIFRFVSIIGERYTHGHILDFYLQLKEHPELLNILGDGKQTKSYLYIQDCIKAIVSQLHSTDKHAIFNLGTNETITVNESAIVIAQELKATPKLVFSGGRQGWIGDNPLIHLDTTKIQATGWEPKVTIREGIRKTVRWLCAKE